MSPLSKRTYYALAVLILLVAAGLRLWNLTTLPIGFSDVELSHINVVEDNIQRGSIRVFYERDFAGDDSTQTIGQEGLYHLILAAVSIPFGVGTFGLRVLSVLLGMLTLAVVYTLGVRLFGYRTGIISMAFYAILMFPVLLSRLVLVETALPLMVAAVMLALARALPVYYRIRAETSNTLDYASMGILISMSFYLHENSLFISLMAMIFIGYVMISQRQASTRRLSYMGFGILMLIIISMPYALSTWRLPELSANTRILGAYESITLSIIESTLGLMWQGDSNPLYNLPQRPMMDLISGLILIIGVVVSIQKWRDARYALILIAIVVLAPPAILGDQSPNFLEMVIVLPIITLLIGIGAAQIITLVTGKAHGIAIALIVMLCIGNLAWTIDSLFNKWVALPEVQVAYHSDIGQIAHHFDQTADHIPVVICNPQWNRTRTINDPYNDVDLVKLHMNRDSAHMREVDCRNGFVFANAGNHQQVLLIDPMQAIELFPLVADWLSLGTSVIGLPEGMVIDMQVQSELEDALGIFTTTSPASYATESDVSALVPIAPPIRFGGNVTWLGYESDPFPIYTPDLTIPVSTYWRIEGLVPSDLLVFTHLLSDPLFPVAQVDTIYIDPTELMERDIYLHNANLPLQATIESGDYVVSVGIYQSSSDDRLPVFIDDGIIQGNRIFLYQLTIDSSNPSGN